jgi:class 3 adenylate cyclase
VTEQRTVAFVDLCGYTRMTGVHGDEQAVAQLEAFRRVVREAVDVGCAEVIRWLGDGVFLAGRCPDDVLAALRMIDDEPVAGGRLATRAGVATGPVVAFDDDDMAGSTVNLAARLCDAATAHQVLADAPTAADLLVGGAERLAAIAVKGFDEPVDVYDLSHCAHDRRAVDPVCGMEIDDPPPVREVTATGEVWFCSKGCADRWRRTEHEAEAVPGA